MEHDGTSCCIGCHFDYEDEHALPCLPPWARRLLEDEHDKLRFANFPWPEVKAHAEREMGFFLKYCRPEVIARIERDHQKFGDEHGG